VRPSDDADPHRRNCDRCIAGVRPITLCRFGVIAAVLLMTIKAVLLAQSPVETRHASLAGGFAMPIDDYHFGTDVTDRQSSLTIAPAIWSELVGRLSSKLSVHTGIESSAGFDLVRDFLGQNHFHYNAKIHHRETVLSALAGFRSHGHRVNAIGLLGGAVVIGRTHEDIGVDGASVTPSKTTTITTTFLPAIIGGVDLPIDLSPRISIVPRLRVRFGWHRANRTDIYGSDTDVFARFGLSPGIGVQVHF
jgi:hypothetical protein